MLSIVAIAVSACGVELPLPEASRIVCTSDAQCPEGLSCQLSARRCVDPGDEDLEAPRLISASATDLTHVLLQLTEEIDPSSIADARVEVVPDLHVQGLVLADGLRDVTIEVASQRPGRDYSVRLEGVRDLAGNAIADVTSRPFTGFGAFPDREPPVIVGPSADALFSPGTVTLSWSSRSLAESYTVDVALDASFTQQIPDSPFSITAPTTTLDVTAIDARRYHWRVRANTTREGAFATSSFDMLGDTLHVACPGATVCSDVGTSGNVSAPMQTLQGALTRAAQRGIERILIATRGDDTYAGHLVIAGSLSIQGGYDASFAEGARDVSQRPTTIAGDSGTTLTILGSSRVVLDGLVVRSTTGNAIDIDGNLVGDVAIVNSIIEAGDVGIAVRNSDTSTLRVRLERNSLRGIAGSGRMVGVDLDHAGARLVDNTMSFLGRGIGASFSTVVMERNTLLIDLARDANAYAAYLTTSDVTLRDNFFSAPSFGGDSVGLAILGISSEPTSCTVVNNVIVANEASSFSRNYISCSGVHTTVANNIFVSGESARSLSLQNASSSTDAIFVNNIFVAAAGATRTCLMQYRSASLTDLRNNAFVGCSELYANDDDTLLLTSIGQVNDPAQLDVAGSPRTGANIRVADLATLALAGPPTDYRLTSMTPGTVRSTGVNTAANTCGAAVTRSCGEVVADKDGVTRTCPSAAQCFSMGPYEAP